MEVFVSSTTASCTGFLFRAVGTPGEIADVEAAVEAFNADEAWSRRGCDGNAEVQHSEDEAVSFWKDRVETEAETFEEICEVLREDGDVVRCAAADLADYLRSYERQAENLLPGAV